MSNLDGDSQIKNVFNNEDPPKKRRRRKPNIDNEEPQNEVEEATYETPKKKHRRKRRNLDAEPEVTSSNHIGVAAYLEDLQDDIEIHAADDDISHMDQLTMSRGKAAISQGAGDTVYVEGSRKFRAENQVKYMNDKLKESQKISERLNMNEDHYDNDLLQCAITIAERFRILATFLHGIFSGLVLMYTVFSLVAITLLSDPTSIKGVLSLYTYIQQPFSIFNYLIFIFIGVSIMDRCDMAQASSKCSQHQGAVILALLMILIAFILNNSLYYFDPFFRVLKVNFSNTQNVPTNFSSWSTVDAIKSVLVVVSWFVIALVPVYDRFVENMQMDLKQGLVEESTSARRYT